MLKWLKGSRTLHVWLCWAGVVLLWEAAFHVVAWKPWIFPAPTHVFESLVNLLGPAFKQVGESQLLVAIATSLTRLVVGFVLSLVLGLMLGLAMWRYKFVDDMLGPGFLGLQTLPSVCWVPVAIILLGLNESSILFVLVMGSFFAISISLRDGLRATPPIYRAAGRVFGARGWRFYWHVMLPSGLPALAGSLRSGFSFAWRSLMGGELILVLKQHGLGHLLHVGREFGDIAQVIAVMIVMVVIGMAADKLAFARIERKVQKRFGFIH